MDLIVLIGVFVATAIALVAAYVFVNRRRFSAADEALRRLTVAEKEQQQRRHISILKSSGAAGAGLFSRLLAGRFFTDGLADALRRTGTTVTPAAFVQLTLGVAVVGVLLGASLGSIVFAVLLGAIGLASPYIWMRRRQRRRLQQFQAQLPDAIDMLVSAMKAGYSFQAAMNFIGEEVGEPLGAEFARFYDEQRLGIDVRTALLSLQGRMDSMDLKMFVTAVLVQRESGGNLGEVLANISDIMRERFAIEGELQTLTAESRLSARILAALPIIVFLGMFALNPNFMRPMLTQSTGQMLLAGAALSVVAGYFVMVKIADIEV